VLFAIAIAAATLVVTPGLADPFLLPKQVLLHLFAVTTLFLWGPTTLFRQIKPLTIALLIVTTLGFCFSTMVAVNRLDAINGAAVWLDIIIIAGGFLRVADDRENRETLRSVFVGLGCFEAIISIIQLLGPVITGTGGLRRLDAVGTIGNPEMVAGFLGMTFFLHWYHKSQTRNVAQWIIGLILCAGIVTCRSRGSWIAVVITMVVLFAIRWRRLIRPQILLLILAGIGFATTAAVFCVHLFPEHLGDLHTLKGRFLLWMAGWHMIVQSHGLGIGMDQVRYHLFDSLHALFATGSFSSFGSNAAMVYRLHNEYIDLLSEGGVLVWGAAIGGLGSLLCRMRHSYSNPQTLPFVGVVLFTLFFSLVSFPLHIVPAMLCCAFAIMVIVNDTTKQTVRMQQVSAATFKTIALITAVTVMIGISFCQARLVAASYYLNQAKRSIKCQNYKAASQITQRGLVWAPQSYDLLLTSARIAYHQFHTEQALEILSRMASQGESVDAIKLRGLVLEDLGYLTQALVAYQTLATAYPNHITPWYRQGLIYLKLNQIDEGRRCLQTSLTRTVTSDKGKREQTLARMLLRSRVTIKEDRH
jgi:hypothetical protein